MRTCSVEGCHRPYDSGGFCSTHRKRVKRHGDPNKVIAPHERYPRCAVAECSRPARYGILCARHSDENGRCKRCGLDEPDFVVVERLIAAVEVKACICERYAAVRELWRRGLPYTKNHHALMGFSGVTLRRIYTEFESGVHA